MARRYQLRSTVQVPEVVVRKPRVRKLRCDVCLRILTEEEAHVVYACHGIADRTVVLCPKHSID